ncbi:hypothetical protein J132_07483, partial [Termitomyces sp. J132]
LYNMLPPPRSDMDNVLAILFTGPCQPSNEDLKCLLLLVCRNTVQSALEWLKLNHIAYTDIEILQECLDQYIDGEPPVNIIYHESAESAKTVNPAVHDVEGEQGVELGDCPFVVHRLTGQVLSAKTKDELKGIALKHLESNGKVLAVGHNSQPVNWMKDNSVYSQMFPWLFSYGLGGPGCSNVKISIRIMNLIY